jgi:DNA-binding NtrC family response regulator
MKKERPRRMRTKGRIFILDDDELIVSMLSRALKRSGYEVQGENDPEGVMPKVESFAPDIVMLDITLPGRSGMDILKELKKKSVDTQIVMLTADSTAETAVEAMKSGAADYLTKPFNIEEVRIVMSKLIEKERLIQEVNYLRRVSAEREEREIIGDSAVMREIKGKAQKLAQAGVSTVLITGESGTGKELVARYVHSLMYSRDSSAYAPFLAINCTALPENLVESEFFGHEKGSFTDAKWDKKGAFELASGGSILLDEIADMRLDLQGKILRVLEERTIRRVGGKNTIPVNVAVIAATNKDLKDAVEKKEFRMDLYYRLNAFTLSVPPLRERREDIPVLARHFLALFTSRYNKKTPRSFSPGAEGILLSYPWPGNVRELKNAVERIAVLESSETVLPEHLPREIAAEREPEKEAVRRSEEGMSLEEIEKRVILDALAKSNHNMTRAAKLLNVSYDTLRYRMKKYGIR